MIRPSGTEPVLRVYAEAPTIEEVRKILKITERLSAHRPLTFYIQVLIGLHNGEIKMYLLAPRCAAFKKMNSKETYLVVQILAIT